MSVYISNTDIPKNIVGIEKLTQSITEKILDTIPSYIRSYYTENSESNVQTGFYVYLKKIVTYILSGLTALFDLKVNLLDSDIFKSKYTDSNIPSYKTVICAQKICQSIGITDTDVTGFTILEDGLINEEQTRLLQMQYLQALYTSTTLKRMFDGSYASYSTLLSTILPGASEIQIQDQGTLSDPIEMSVAVNVDAIGSNVFSKINVDVLKSILVPKLLTVNTNIDIADITTMYWDYKTVVGVDGTSNDENYAMWDERNWVGEY